MSSETSTDKVRLKPDTTEAGGSVRLQPDHGLQPWQFFVLAALGCATAVTFIARGQSVTSIVFLSILMATAALVLMSPNSSGTSLESLGFNGVGGLMLGTIYPILGWLIATRRPESMSSAAYTAPTPVPPICDRTR